MSDAQYAESNSEIKRLEIEIAKAEVFNQGSLPELQERIKEQRKARSLALNRLGLSDEDFVPKYVCGKCNDTGYMKNGASCDCYYKYLHSQEK